MIRELICQCGNRDSDEGIGELGLPECSAECGRTMELYFDPVHHPAHYNAHPSGVECIAIAEHMNYCLGQVLKYIWRAGLKDGAVQDLEKARWYLDREIDRIQRPDPDPKGVEFRMGK